MTEEQEGYFICDCCHRTLPDEECFGVVYTSLDPVDAELWCEDCGYNTEFVEEPFGHTEPKK